MGRSTVFHVSCCYDSQTIIYNLRCRAIQQFEACIFILLKPVDKTLKKQYLSCDFLLYLPTNVIMAVCIDDQNYWPGVPLFACAMVSFSWEVSSSQPVDLAKAAGSRRACITDTTQSYVNEEIWITFIDKCHITLCPALNRRGNVRMQQWYWYINCKMNGLYNWSKMTVHVHGLCVHTYT